MTQIRVRVDVKHFKLVDPATWDGISAAPDPVGWVGLHTREVGGVEEQRPRFSVPRCLLLAVPSAATLVGLQTTRQLLHRPGRSVCLQWRRNDALLRHSVSRMEACCPSTAGPCTFLFSSSAWASPSADPLTCARSTSARRSDGSTTTTTDHVADEPHAA
jgi:hypothetical protein